MRAERLARGFTLLEVLIALAVVAIALTALIRAAGLASRDFVGLRDRGFAGWIAANVITDSRLTERNPSPGLREGKVQYAGRAWRWELTVQDTAEAGLHRLDVRVFLGDEHDSPSATLTGFSSDILRP